MKTETGPHLWLKDSVFSDKPDYPTAFIALIGSIGAIGLAFRLSLFTPIAVLFVFLLADYSLNKISESFGAYAGTRLVSLSVFFAWIALSIWVVLTFIIIFEAFRQPLPIMNL